jgi:hypothetical protein
MSNPFYCLRNFNFFMVFILSILNYQFTKVEKKWSYSNLAKNLNQKFVPKTILQILLYICQVPLASGLKGKRKRN